MPAGPETTPRQETPPVLPPRAGGKEAPEYPPDTPDDLARQEGVFRFARQETLGLIKKTEAQIKEYSDEAAAEEKAGRQTEAGFTRQLVDTLIGQMAELQRIEQEDAERIQAIERKLNAKKS